MSRSKRTVQARSLRTREAILAAATDLFATRGFDGTAVQDIADRAEVSKGAFYHCFATKLDVLMFIHDRFVDQQALEIERIEAAQMEPRDALAAFVHSLLQTVASYQTEVTIFVQENRFFEQSGYDSIRAKRENVTERLVRLLAAGVDGGVFKSVDQPQLLAFGIIGMCSWAYQWYRPKDGPVEAVADAYVRTLLGGLVEP